jgi:signal transduction histidine kinase
VREPIAALIIVPAMVLSFVLFQLMTVAAGVAALISGYRLGYSGSRLVVVLGLPFLALALAGTDGVMRVFAVLLASLVPTAAAVGTAQRARSQAVQNDAAHQAIAGRLREHMVRGERARIARELHDVVAHHISMIAVQAETARLTVADLPPDGARQLRGIGDTARAGLTEMRRLLGVLREDAQAEAGDRQPQPGLAQLNELLDEAREISGAGVRLIVQGPPDPLDPGVELAAYRIVQEALTNARRHAPGAAVDVELRYTARALRLRIRDNGPGPTDSVDPEASGRHGLLGIRERTAAVGGRVWIGPAAGGGFLIEVSLPASAGPEREAR